MALLRLPDGSWINAQKVVIVRQDEEAVAIDYLSDEERTYFVDPEDCKQFSSEKAMTARELVDRVANLINDHLRAEGGDK